MDCEQAKEMIMELAYDELPSESVPGLQEHLAKCKKCLEYKEEMQQTLNCLNQAEDIRAPVDLAALHDAIDNRQHRIKRFLRRSWPAWAAIGVCGIMLTIFALFVSEISYEGNALTVRFNGQKTDSLAERTSRILAAYREDQTHFQTQMSDELRSSVAALSKMIDEYESQRDEQLTGAFKQVQLGQRQMLIAIQDDLEALASRTEDEFKRSYLTMAALADWE